MRENFLKIVSSNGRWQYLALVYFHQSKPMKGNMEEPGELVPLKKFTIQKLLIKEMILTKEGTESLKNRVDSLGRTLTTMCARLSEWHTTY